MEPAPLDAPPPAAMAALRWRPLMRFMIEIAPPWVVGPTPAAHRRIGAIAGGRFAGERLRGEILPGGSDWQTVRSDSAWAIDVRMLMRTADDALIAVRYTGLRHGPPEVIAAIARGEDVSPDAYYMRVVPSFETAAPAYDWLNRVIAVGHGHRVAGGALYSVFEIL